MAATVLYDPATERLMSLLHNARVVPRRILRWRRDREDGNHAHAMPTLYLCLAGVCRVEGDGRIDLQPGEAVLIGTGVRHWHRALRPGAAVLDLGLVAGWCDFNLAGFGHDLWCRVPRQPYEGLLCRMQAASDDSSVLSMGRQILAHLQCERIEAMAFPHLALRNMAGVLWSNKATINAERVLAASGLRRRQAHDLFKTFFGQTPRCALEDQRLAIAAAHLGPGRPGAAAPRRAGYTCRAALTRAWSRRHGRPPTG